MGIDPTTLPPIKRHSSPRFSPYVYYGQTAGLIKTPLGTEVDLAPGDIVLNGDPGPLKRGTAPTFRPMSIVAKRPEGSRCHLVRLVRGRPRPRPHCVRWAWAENLGLAVPPFLFWGGMGPHLIQCDLGQGLPLYQVAT